MTLGAVVTLSYVAEGIALAVIAASLVDLSRHLGAGRRSMGARRVLRVMAGFLGLAAVALVAQAVAGQEAVLAAHAASLSSTVVVAAWTLRQASAARRGDLPEVVDVARVMADARRVAAKHERRAAEAQGRFRDAIHRAASA